MKLFNKLVYMLCPKFGVMDYNYHQFLFISPNEDSEIYYIDIERNRYREIEASESLTDKFGEKVKIKIEKFINS